MARRGGTTRKTKMTFPLAVALGFVPLLARGVNDFRAGGVAGLSNTVSAIVPYDVNAKKISFANLSSGLYPIIAGFLLHKIVGGGLGLNRALARMGIPMLRI
jgi:hypothetical protein